MTMNSRKVTIEKIALGSVYVRLLPQRESELPGPRRERLDEACKLVKHAIEQLTWALSENPEDGDSPWCKVERSL